MDSARLVALGVFVSYFLTILFLFYLILGSFRGLYASSNQRKAVTFAGLSIVSFAHTWFYMFKFLHWSFTTYESTASTIAGNSFDRLVDWLINTELFEQAWAAVSFGENNWWWSEQLCLFTVGFWTAFLYIEGKRYNIEYIWAYMLLGQLVAISVASNLFYLSIVLHGPVSPPSMSRAPMVLWLSTVVAHICVFRSPYTDQSEFLLNLLGMHGLICIPLFFIKSARFTIPTRVLYATYAAISVVMRVKTMYAVRAGGLLATLHSHPAQSSIGYDVVWTTISFFVWASMEYGFTLPALFLSILMPVSTTAAMIVYNQ